MIIQSPLDIQLEQVLMPTISDLAQFLRKHNRALRLATLQLLICCSDRYRGSLSAALSNVIVQELPSLINESDLQVKPVYCMCICIFLKNRTSFLQY